MMMRSLAFLRRFGRARRGATAVEFAFVAAPFLALIFAIFELGLVFLVQTTLDGATDDAARQIRTGQMQAAKATAATFKTAVCSQMSWLGSSCGDKLKVDVQTFTSFGQKPKDVLENGAFNAGNVDFKLGVGQDIVVVRTFYEWTLITPLLNTGLVNLGGTKRMITSTATFRNEAVLMLAFLNRFRRDHRGVAAVEFALVALPATFFYLGLAEATQAIMAKRRSDHIASAVGDLVSQSSQLSNADIADIFLIAKTIIEPFSESGVKVRVTSVTIDSKGVAKVDWCDVSGSMSDLTDGSTYPDPPAGLVGNGESFIVAESNYTYTSAVGGLKLDFKDKRYLRPRRSTKVMRTA